MRVTDLSSSLGWDKSRVAHLLTRMEARGLLSRFEAGAAGRRTGIALTPAGAELLDRAIHAHGSSLGRFVFDRLTRGQAQAISSWGQAFVADTTMD